MSSATDSGCAAAGFTTLGLLSRRDFYAARRRAPFFTRWKSYREFLFERDSLLLGYSAAGVSAHWQKTPLAAFERWCRLTGAPADIDGLDEFAAHWRWRVENPGAPTRGRAVAAAGAPHAPVAESGAQVLPVRRRTFQKWRREFAQAGLLPAPSLNAYATHAAECCLPFPAPVPRRAVNSA